MGLRYDPKKVAFLLNIKIMGATRPSDDFLKLGEIQLAARFKTKTQEKSFRRPQNGLGALDICGCASDNFWLFCSNS